MLRGRFALRKSSWTQFSSCVFRVHLGFGNPVESSCPNVDFYFHRTVSLGFIWLATLGTGRILLAYTSEVPPSRLLHLQHVWRTLMSLYRTCEDFTLREWCKGICVSRSRAAA